MKKETGRLPSQTVQNPRGNVSAVMLRSGKQLVVELEMPREGECSRENEEDPTGIDPTSGPSDAPQALGTSDIGLGQDASQTLRSSGSAPRAAGPVLQQASEGRETPAPDRDPASAASEPLQTPDPTSVPSDASLGRKSQVQDSDRPQVSLAPGTSDLCSQRPASPAPVLSGMPRTSAAPKAPGPDSTTDLVPTSGTKPDFVSLPFPVPNRAPRKYVMDKDVWELFSRVEINIPLLEAIKQIPRYAKFLKELCTNRRRGTCVDQELMSRNVSVVIQRTVPPKCGDPGTYTIPCTIGNIRIENCMLDLGASINVLPYSIYSSLRIGPLEPAGLTIQLADRSCKQPEGKIEDVLVQVGELVFSADFYVLKMENCGPNDHAPILLGRPFLKTSKMKIDCESGMLSMEVEGEVFSFDIFRAMKHPLEFETVHALDTLDDLVHEAQPERELDPLELVLDRALYSAESSFDLAEGMEGALTDLGISMPLTPRYEVNEIRLYKTNTCLPSIVQAPKVELKPLPDHLKYVYLGENGTLPVIIKNGLEMDQERKLIEVLSRHKKAIGWTLGDLRGISPAVCMHRILLEDGARPSRQPQRRLNPIMMEVVQKEIQKLLDADVISLSRIVDG
ncbi:unnamed protein product [Rhodiola kirilowii]